MGEFRENFLFKTALGKGVHVIKDPGLHDHESTVDPTSDPGHLGLGFIIYDLPEASVVNDPKRLVGCMPVTVSIFPEVPWVSSNLLMLRLQRQSE